MLGPPFFSPLFVVEREILHQKWKKAVDRSLGWEIEPAEEPSEGTVIFFVGLYFLRMQPDTEIGVAYKV